MVTGWKRNLWKLNSSDDDATKQQWEERGKQIFRLTSPALPQHIRTAGTEAGEDSQDEDDGYQKGSRKELELVMPYWLSWVAEEMFYQSWRCRVGRDKEHRMELHKAPPPLRNDRIGVPVDAKCQWMVDDTYKVPEEHEQGQPQAVNANELAELPDMFKKHDLSVH